MSQLASTPVTLITGFLGSGKTTFVNWLLDKHHEKNISLILNEFGDVKLESQFIEQSSVGEVAELANGCMCCVAKSDIPRVIDFILTSSPQTEHIVIEASGLSDPEPIHDAFSDPRIVEKVHLCSVVCIVDAVHFEQARSEHSIVMSQIGDADLVLISKASLVDDEQVDRIKNFLERVIMKTHVLIWDDELDPDLFLNEDDTSALAEGEHHHDHTHEQYDEVWFVETVMLDLDKLMAALRQLPKNVVRAKGYVYHTKGKALIQYVNGQVEYIPSAWNEGEKPGTNLLLLGKDLDKKQILQTLRQ